MPISLVTKPTADQEVRENIISMLKKALGEAESGQIVSLVMILGHIDGEWSDRASETLKMSEAIGRLEITKQEWIARFLQES